MPEFLQLESRPWLLPALAVLLLLLAWLLYRFVRSRRNSLRQAFKEISFERIEGLIIPSADEGEIQIDQLLLTSKGLLIVDIKDVQGTVFGSDKMQDWAVISDERRYTFSNPQPMLYDRIAAVRQVVRQVPVAGRILFLDGAEFTKGIPGLVCTLNDLVEEFGEPDKKAAKFKIEAFRPHWELIQEAAISSTSR
ncbi:MAG: NERD domain-containing protein [Gammaproteobacteria bacterium]|nr:NERD domain-containing protein [Gammaproteobacteria bacterium]MBT8111104.1 NERD domain-containing protein [Gammaproteobacteria bacterium]NND48021.1 NERD domain-containing protein [Woeseiaceae bacterium]NNL45802.1 NERD domain-containing protein [Woeseiaceae bacterium]